MNTPDNIHGFKEKYYALDGAGLPCSWRLKEGGTFLNSESGYFKEVEYVPYATEPWKEPQLWTLADARKQARAFGKMGDVRAIRIIKWELQEWGGHTIFDICEFAQYPFVGKYPYNSSFDNYIKEWVRGECLFSFEQVKREE